MKETEREIVLCRDRKDVSLPAADSFIQLVNEVHVFWGDEPCVSPDHSQNNYRMGREGLGT